MEELILAMVGMLGGAVGFLFKEIRRMSRKIEKLVREEADCKARLEMCKDVLDKINSKL